MNTRQELIERIARVAAQPRAARKVMNDLDHRVAAMTRVLSVSDSVSMLPDYETQSLLEHYGM